MPLPDTVTIGPIDYTITDDTVTHAMRVVSSSCDPWGEIDYGAGLIVLRPGQSPAHQRLVLVHEILHGCYHVTTRDHEDDEAAVLALAGPLLDVLRRNPALVAFLVEG